MVADLCSTPDAPRRFLFWDGGSGREPQSILFGGLYRQPADDAPQLVGHAVQHRALLLHALGVEATSGGGHNHVAFLAQA